MSDEHMWLIPFTDGQDHLLTVDLGKCSPLIGLRVWNYNKSTDDSFRGVRNVTALNDTLTKPFRPPTPTTVVSTGGNRLQNILIRAFDVNQMDAPMIFVWVRRLSRGAGMAQWWEHSPSTDSWTRRHMWVEFVVGSLLCSERFFSGYSGFPLSSKTNTKFQFDPECSDV